MGEIQEKEELKKNKLLIVENTERLENEYIRVKNINDEMLSKKNAVIEKIREVKIENQKQCDEIVALKQQCRTDSAAISEKCSIIQRLNEDLSTSDKNIKYAKSVILDKDAELAKMKSDCFMLESQRVSLQNNLEEALE